GPPRSPAVLKITPNWDELTPASAGLFFFTHATSRERERGGGATRLCANRLCTGTEPAMQKPIATLAVGGLINATLLTRSSSQRTRCPTPGERAARGSRPCRASSTQ